MICKILWSGVDIDRRSNKTVNIGGHSLTVIRIGVPAVVVCLPDCIARAASEKLDLIIQAHTIGVKVVI